jgi:hypothetical protein
MALVAGVRWASCCKDAGSPGSGTTGATEDAAARRPARPCGTVSISPKPPATRNFPAASTLFSFTGNRALMTGDTIPDERRPAVEPLDAAIDHVRGPAEGRLILEYGDYECPFSRQAFRAIERVEQEMSVGIRFAFRHFPLVEVHPHAFASAAAAEAAAIQGRFWEMHDLLFHRQKALRDDDLQLYAGQLELDVARFDQDRFSPRVLRRIRRDVESGIASGEVRGTPTLFIDGAVHLGGYDAATLTEALAG